MKTKEEIKERLEKFKKDNPSSWVYGTNNEGIKSVYQTTIKELEWVLK